MWPISIFIFVEVGTCSSQLSYDIVITLMLKLISVWKVAHLAFSAFLSPDSLQNRLLGLLFSEDSTYSFPATTLRVLLISPFS